MKRYFFVFVSILLLAAGCNKQQAQVQPQQSQSGSHQTNSADVTANWRTYTNDKYGYQVKYPSDLIVDKNSPAYNVDFLDNSKGGDAYHSVITITAIPWSNPEDIDKYAENLQESLKSLTKKTSVAGRPAVRSDYDAAKDRENFIKQTDGLTPPDLSLNSVTFYNQGFQYSLTANGRPDILNGLIQTFTFTK